jgi:hypothetical protein
VRDLREGVAVAARTIDDQSAQRTLDTWITRSNA